MSKGSIKDWQIKLGVTQVAVLLGLALGSVTTAYYLGLSTGQHGGLESALAASASQVAKLPINAPQTKEFRGQVGERAEAGDLYAKLDSVAGESAKGNMRVGAPEDGEEQEQTLADIKPHQAGEEAVKKLAILAESKQEDAKKQMADKQVVNRAAGVNQLEGKGLEAKVEKEGGQQVLGQQAKGQQFAKSVEAGAVKQPAKVAAIESQVPKGTKYFVQCAAPNNQQDAQELVTQLKASGFSAKIEQAKVGNAIFYRVLSGPEINEATASRLAEQISREKFIKSKPFVKRVE